MRLCLFSFICEEDKMQRSPEKSGGGGSSKKRPRRVIEEAEEQEEEEAEPTHPCTQCDAAYSSLKRLNQHTKRVHAPVANQTCPFCAQVFSNAGSLPRHTTICRQRPEKRISCVMPASKVPASPTSPHNKSRSGKKSYAAVERYLARLVEFLKAGDFTHSSESRLEPLAPLTIVSYQSFVRKFLEAVVEGLVAGHGDGMYSDDVSEPPFSSFVLLLIYCVWKNRNTYHGER
jgi:hypothetical protein